jgi:hypothetical protein
MQGNVVNDAVGVVKMKRPVQASCVNEYNEDG